MKNKVFLGLATGALLMIQSAISSAAIVSGDFRTESNLPDYYTGQALVYQNLGTSVEAGAELTGANFLVNPSGWGGGLVHMDLDASTNILTLSSKDTWDFQTFDAFISNIAFDANEIITGVSLISGNLTTTNLLALMTFTDNSVHIGYSTSGIFNFTGTQAQFQIHTASVNAVPVPGAIWLLGSGLTGLMGMRRKKVAV